MDRIKYEEMQIRTHNDVLMAGINKFPNDFWSECRMLLTPRISIFASVVRQFSLSHVGFHAAAIFNGNITFHTN
jgi:hypothetical protein